MEKLILNEEQEKRFIKHYLNGDIYGFEELRKILKEEIKLQDKDNDYSIYDLLRDTIALNNMVVWGYEMTSGLVDLENDIYNLYDKLKQKLFNCFENNFEKYF